MSQLVCPLCSESLSEEGNHFYKHFRYKRYACGDNKCELEFYTEAERNAHCTKHGHKRSFQKTVNPYTDRIISMIREDAQELATKDMETVMSGRWGTELEQKTPKNGENPVKSPGELMKKRRRNSSNSTPTTSKKQKTISSTLDEMRKNQTNSSRNAPGASTSSAPSSSGAPGNSQAIVDSTTNDERIVEKAKKSAKKTRKESENQAKSKSNEITPSVNLPYEEMSALEKVAGFFDPNVPERINAAKVKCSVCKEDIVYDYLIRKGHVTRFHMNADVDPKDYDHLLRSAMDASFPDLPNSDKACQLCMTGTDVRSSLRREHIENMHTTSIPVLICPFAECQKGYRRQCDLSSHMKDTHKTPMSKYKDREFHNIRQRRNAMINVMINKCFPWSLFEALNNKHTEDKSEPSPLMGVSLNKDVRIKEANKTRRAPQYNASGDSSSSESEGEEGDGSEKGDQLGIAPESHQDFEKDVIFIGEHFNAEVAKMLSERAQSLLKTIKPEVVDVDDNMDIDPVAEEITPKEEIEEPPKEDIERIPLPSPISILDQYQPTVPKAPSNSPELLNRTITSTTSTVTDGVPAKILSATPRIGSEERILNAETPRTPSRYSDRSPPSNRDPSQRPDSRYSNPSNRYSNRGSSSSHHRFPNNRYDNYSNPNSYSNPSSRFHQNNHSNHRSFSSNRYRDHDNRRYN